MEIRSFEIRAVDTDTRTIEGIAAPYDEVFEQGDFNERFEPGVFGDFNSDANVRLYAEHDHLDKQLPIGVVTEGRSTKEGFVIRARISETAKGNEAYALLKDGVLRNFSVGFIPGESTFDEKTNTVTHTRADLKEVSVVAFPAYKNAQVLAVRSDSANGNGAPVAESINERGHNEKTMTEINYASAADLAEVRDAINALDQKVSSDNKEVSTATPQFRTAGEFIKALAAGDEAAKMDIRAYTGAVVADSHTSADWKSELLGVVNRGRPVVDLFNKGPLGDHGLTVSYPYVSAFTGDVAKQAAEGDNLAYLEISIATGTANVETYGGYSEISRQAIERSDVSYLDEVLKFQAASYAKVTNAKVRSTMVAATPQTGTSFTLSSATAADLLGAVIDGVSKIDANGQGAQADFILVSQDVFARMAAVASTGFAFDANNSAGATIGNANIRGMSGSLAGLPIVVDQGLANKSFYVCSHSAVTTWENAGAPVSLQDENIINLTKQFSLYGYLAVGVTNAMGLVKATVA
jgi:HK97 family phage prohead protease